MNRRLFHRVIGGSVFLISAVQLLLTAQPTVPFWDPGELSAAAYLLQVPHPPGGPLFSLIGRVLYLLPIPGDLGFRMNLLSAMATTFTVLFLYLIAVKLIKNFQGNRPDNDRESLGTYLSGAIGALAFSFADTIWFNGVESNYFAGSTLLFSAMIWLILKWNEVADQEGSNRYLVLIAYLAGLSAGVHLMSVPTIFAAVMIVMFRNYVRDDAACKKTGNILLAHAAILLLVTFGMWNALTASQPPSPEDAHAYDLKFVMAMAAISAAIMGVLWKKVFHRDSLYVSILISGVALGIVYPGVIKKLPQLIHTLSGNDSTLGVVILFGVIASLAYLASWAARNKRIVLHISAIAVLFIILGFSTYTMIVIRANHRTPMNENNPSSFSGLLTYLNREQYGDFPIFKRRWTTEPDRQRTFTRYSSDFDFFWRYQMNHMFTRYVLFNFAGRESREQDADWTWRQLFGIPFLVGLFGIYSQFKKDWRMATVFLILFIIMGFLIAFYQNQQEPQPRERDYFYGGAYFVFALWIAMGMKGLLDFVAGAVKSPHAAGLAFSGVIAFGAVFIPVRMAQTNWHTHDRSKNWLAWENSYNMLQTCEKDAILFTNGDNDTFPLWYLQDVEEIRRDVRIVNLSLGNTPWYIQQMKDKPYYREAQAVPISIPDSRIASIEPVLWEPRVVQVPVPADIYSQFGITDTSVTSAGKIEWRMPNSLQFGQTKAIRVQDILVRNVIETNQWKRPIYFACTCAPDSKIGLDDYLKLCGLAFRLVPVRTSRQDLAIEPAIMEANLLTEPAGFARTPQYGYKFRTMADTSIFFDDNENRMVSWTRSAFRYLAIYYAERDRDLAKSARVIERMEKVIPPSRMQMTVEEGIDFSQVYYKLGNTERFNELARRVEEQFKAMTEAGPARNPYLYAAMLQFYELRKDYAAALAMLKDLARQYPNDPSIKARIDSVQARLNRSAATPAP